MVCNLGMKCPKCEKVLRGKKDSYDYSDKSFEGVSIDCKKYECKKCKNTFYDLGDDDDINRQICDLLLQQKTLQRKQLKYIIEQVFDESIFQFAKRIKTNPTHLKGLINSKKILSQELSDKISEKIYLKFKTPTITLEC